MSALQRSLSSISVEQWMIDCCAKNEKQGTQLNSQVPSSKTPLSGRHQPPVHVSQQFVLELNAALGEHHSQTELHFLSGLKLAIEA